jgi:hypothetical protein
MTAMVDLGLLDNEQLLVQVPSVFRLPPWSSGCLIFTMIMQQHPLTSIVQYLSHPILLYASEKLPYLEFGRY